jgi:hypothetical protein
MTTKKHEDELKRQEEVLRKDEACGRQEAARSDHTPQQVR